MVVVRPARPADIDTLCGLLQALFTIEEDFACDAAKQSRGLRMLVDSTRGCLLVAASEAGVIGMCSGQLMISTAEGGLSLLVEDVVVDAKWRGQGVGRLLMAAISEWARALDVTRLQLLADRNNIPALDFYRALGWQTTELICLRTFTEDSPKE